MGEVAPVCPAEVKDTKTKQRGDPMLYTTAQLVDSHSSAALSTRLRFSQETEVTECVADIKDGA